MRERYTSGDTRKEAGGGGTNEGSTETQRRIMLASELLERDLIIRTVNDTEKRRKRERLI